MATVDLSQHTDQQSKPLVTNDSENQTQQNSDEVLLLTNNLENKNQENSDYNDACSYSKVLLKKLQDFAVNRLIENKIPQDGQDWEISPYDAKVIVHEIENVRAMIYEDPTNGFIKMKSEVRALLKAPLVTNDLENETHLNSEKVRLATNDLENETQQNSEKAPLVMNDLENETQQNSEHAPLVTNDFNNEIQQKSGKAPLVTNDLENETQHNSEKAPFLTNDLENETQQNSEKAPLVTNDLENKTQQNSEQNDVCLYSKVLLKKLHDFAVNRVIEKKIPQDGQDWKITPEDAKTIVLEIESVHSMIYEDPTSGLIKMKAEVCALLQPRTKLLENSSRDVTLQHQEGKVAEPLSSTENRTHKDPRQDVKVITPLQSGAISNFFKVFEKKLEEHGLRAIDTRLDTVNTETTCTDVVIVICHKHTRLESNVANALSKIQDRKYKVFLVILHINKLTELPKEYSKLTLYGNSSVDRIDNIVDIAYTKEEGIYDCPMNTHAFQALDNLKSDMKRTVEN